MKKLLFITKQKLYQYSLLVFILTGLYSSTLAQVTIKGPGCMIPGTVCHYVITGKWDHITTMQACVSGGTFNDGSNCTPSGTISNSLFVTWNTNGSGNLTVTSSKGNVSLTVTATQGLNGGNISNADLSRNYISSLHQYIFHCSKATGGSCKPSYIYQWQKSTDMLQWTNIQGATQKDLVFTDSIAQNTFFRRIVYENSSTTIGYSNIANLDIVIPVMPGDSLYNAFVYPSFKTDSNTTAGTFEFVNNLITPMHKTLQ
jgi:hypothetical protein